MDDVHFQIVRVKSMSKNNNETFNAKLVLENLIKNGASISGVNKQNLGR